MSNVHMAQRLTGYSHASGTLSVTLGATGTYGTNGGVLTKGWMPGRYFAHWQKVELARAVECSGWTVESLRVVSNQ